MIVSPSFLSCDFANLQSEIEMLNNSDAQWMHCDIMDGLFVPNITFGQPVLKWIRKHAKKTLDVHLMIVQPERYLQSFKDAGADILTVQYEACTHLHRTIHEIKNLGMKAGVAINPHTSVNLLEDVIADLDMVLVMSVNPGFGGQSFIEHSYEKIRKLRALANERNPKLIIQVDGGVTLENAPKLIEAGATALVAGNTVFNSENPSATIKKLADL